jgi:DNA-binding winged helix-turn-helix (wHTH) protein/tetratricopeptide (TPR) repeat protein
VARHQGSQRDKVTGSDVPSPSVDGVSTHGVPVPTANAVIFGPFKLDRVNYSLFRRDGKAEWQAVAIRRRAFDVLRYMVDNPGRVITPHEFMGALWPTIHVQQEVLKGYILAVRSVLGDDPGAPRYIETLRGRGYRFKAPLVEDHFEEQDVPQPSELLPALVGRRAAIDCLWSQLLAAQAGATQVVFITGEVGIGKTTLSNGFLNIADKKSTVIAVGRCFPGSSETDAYAPLLEILNQLQRSEVGSALSELLPAYAPTWVVQLSDLAGGAVNADTRQDVFGSTPHRVNRELCDLLAALSKETSLVLLIEDIHWADRSTLDFLEAIATRAPQGRLMLLLTLRTPHRGRHVEEAWLMSRRMCLYKRAVEVTLTPLEKRDVEDLLASIAGVPAPPELVHQLHARSEGNPLFLNAIYDYLSNERQIAHSSSGWTVSLSLDQKLGVPPSLAHLISGEIEKLNDRARSVLEAASLSEEPFIPLIYAAGSPVDEYVFEDICEELLRTTGLIRRGDVLTISGGRKVQSYEFRHALFRVIAYDGQSRTRRSAAHARVAERIVSIFEADGSTASLAARHYLAAERWSEAIYFLRQVAQNVMQRFSNREAASALERALALVGYLPKGEREQCQVELLEDLAQVYVGGLDPRANEVYEHLIALSQQIGREDIRCRALLGRAFALAWTDCESSMAIWQEAIDRSSALSDPIARSRIRSAAHGWRSWAAGWSADDAAGCEIAVCELRNAGDTAALNASLVDYTLILFPSSRYIEAYETIVESFAYLIEKVSDQHVDISLPLWIWRLGRPWCMMCAGRLREALELFDSGIAGFLGNGEIGRAAALQFYKALCYVHATQYTEALQLCHDARDMFGENGTQSLSPNEELIGSVSQGLAAIGAGRPVEAMQLLEFAQRRLSEKRTLSAWHWRMAMEWGLVDACLALGQIGDAVEHGQKLRTYALATQEITWRVLAYESSARVALLTNDTDAAREYLSLGRQEAARADVPLAAWRLEAVQSSLFSMAGDADMALLHSRLAEEGLRQITSDLPLTSGAAMMSSAAL